MQLSKYTLRAWFGYDFDEADGYTWVHKFFYINEVPIVIVVTTIKLTFLDLLLTSYASYLKEKV